MTVLGTITGQVRLDIRQAVASYAALRAQNQRTVYALRGTGDSFVAAGQRMAVAGGAMVYGFARVVKAAADFERKMDFASAVSGATADQMKKLSDYALQLGQDTIYSASQIADGFIELSKAGVSVEDIMGGVGKAMTDLAAAADIPLEKSGQIMTSTMQQFELQLSQLTKVTDLISGAANASIADVEDIGVSLKYVGGVAHTAGISFDETATAISILAKAGIRGSTAGTSLRQIITSLSGATEGATSKLMELGIITEDGTNKFFDMKGEVKPLGEVFQILQDSMKRAGYTSKDALTAFKTIFNQRALSSVSVLTRKGAKGFEEMYAEMSKTKAADVAKERLNNLSGDIEILQGNIETLTIKAGSPFQEQLRGWVQGLTKLVQAFANLDPKTQESIVRMVGITGAALVVMGALNIVIGTIFKFVAGMLKFAAGIKFAVKILRILITNLRWAAVLFGGELAAALAAVTLPVWLVVAAIVALAAGFVIAYKKSEAFRRIVNNIAGAFRDGLEAIVKWFKLLASDPGAAWDQLKKGVSDLMVWIGQQFAKVPGLISKGLSSAGGAAGGLIDSIVGWFASLPGKIGTALLSMGTAIIAFFASLPGRVGYAIGYLLGFIAKQFLLLPSRILAALIGVPTAVLNVFSTLAPKVGYALGFLIGKVVGFFIRLGINMVKLTIRAVTGVINFFKQLPGRVASFVARMVARAIALFNTVKTQGPKLIAQMVTGVINWFRQLPSRTATFLTNMVTKVKAGFSRAKNSAIEMAGKLLKGFIDGIKGLPGQALGIVDQAIAMFKEAASRAFNAAKSFAKGLWDGFKDGLGINSPSLIEKQMYQINRVAGEETKKMAKKTMKIQRISRQLAKTQFTVGDPGMPSSLQDYRRLAVMQSRNQKRAGTLAEGVGKRSARASTTIKMKKGPTDLQGMLRLHPDGYAMIAGIAEDVYDNFTAQNNRRNR